MNGFEFAHPLIAAGAAGVLAPIIIHFLFRRRAREIKFSAMRWVLLSYRKVARRLLVQEYLLLVTRCLMVLALALSLAIPSFTRMIRGVRRGEKPLAVIFVLDTSLSMSRSADGKNLLDSARGVVSDWLLQLGPADRMGIIDAARLHGGELTAEHETLKKNLQGITIAAAPARLAEAITLAAEKLAAFPDADRMIIVLTDLQRSGWQRPVESKSGLPPLYIIDLAAKLPPRNLAVNRLHIKWRTTARDKTLTVAAEITNAGSDDWRQVLVRVKFKGQTAAQGFVDVPAEKSVKKNFELTEVPPGPAELELAVDDGMTGDNTAYFDLRGGQEVRALVVDGDPGASYLDSETYFLNQALDPRLYARSRIHPRTITTQELPAVNLSDYAVLILANVDKLPGEIVTRIKNYVKTGHGLFLALGGRVDADTYDAMWGELLPRELRGVKMAYAGAGADVWVMHLELPVADANLHPILGVFQDPSQGDLGLPGFWKFFLMQQEVIPRTQVILRLTDGTPMMVEGRYGEGKVIVFASTVDRDWNNFCIYPTYLPLIQQTVQYLGNAMLREDEGRLRAGSVLEVPVGSDVAGAQVRTPDQRTLNAEVMEDAAGRRVRISETDRPGVYFIKFLRQGEAPGNWEAEQADQTVALNVDPAESDLTRLDPSEISAWVKSDSVRVLTPEQPLDPKAPPVKVKKSYEAWLIWLLVGLAVLERVLTRKG